MKCYFIKEINLNGLLWFKISFSNISINTILNSKINVNQAF